MNNARLREDLYTDHWIHAYDWVGIENIIETVARQYGCTVEDVRKTMYKIERKYPKPKQKGDNS